MKLHRHAKSTLASRLLLVRRVLFEGWSYAQAAEGFAVNVRTVAKWGPAPAPPSRCSGTSGRGPVIDHACRS